MKNKNSVIYILITLLVLAGAGIFGVIQWYQLRQALEFSNSQQPQSTLPVASPALTPTPEQTIANVPLTGYAKKYAISYKIKPKVMYDTSGSQIISFESSLPTNYVVAYGLDGKVDQAVSGSVFQTRHEVKLANLVPQATYTYEVAIFTENGGYNEGFNGTFKTKADQAEDFTFVVWGDSRPPSGFVLPEVFSQLMERVGTEQPDLVIGLGDMVQLSDVGTVEYSEADSAWNAFTEKVSNLTASIPLYLAVGNHDEPGQTNALLRYQEVWNFPRNGGGLKGWYDESTYFFSYAHALFIVLNSEEPGSVEGIGDEQLKWLKKTLQDNTYFPYKFVMTHRPIQGSSRVEYGHGEELHNLFKDYGVTAAIAGHDHLYCQYFYDGILYLTSGGAGSPLYKNLCLGKELPLHHYAVLSVPASPAAGVSVKVVNELGQILDAFDFKPTR